MSNGEYLRTMALAELLYGNYPNLNHKEFAICRTIADTLRGLEGDALYLEVQQRAKHNLAVLLKMPTK